MAEYIEREALLEALDYNPNQRCLVMDGSTFDIVLNHPAADVVEVVHGRWIDHMKCSVCGQVDWTKPNFCPNCGARMDGE